MNGTYHLIDCGNFLKLEQVGPFRLIRPATQAVWRPKLPASEWTRFDAKYIRKSGGEGFWEIKNPALKPQWKITIDSIVFNIQLTDFGHLGIFPEQYLNWQKFSEIISHKKTCNVLNLFAYTGGATLHAAKAGANVVHVDASKTTNTWARENAASSGLKEAPIRWITDDALKFASRERRRGAKYHGIILDPPSFGRGTKGQVWKIEEHLNKLLDVLKQILDENFLFILLTSHTPGFTPLCLKNLLFSIVDERKGEFICSEMVIEGSGNSLPSGTSCLFIHG